MRGWVVAALFVPAFLVQTSLIAPLALWGVRPDLVLVLVCLVALHFGPWEGALVGFAAGLAVDLAGGYLIGLGAIAKALAGGGVGWMGQNVFGGNAYVPVVVVLCGSFVEHVVYLLGMWSFGLAHPLLPGLVRVILPGVWYDALAAAVMAPVFAWTLRRVDVWQARAAAGPAKE